MTKRRLLLVFAVLAAAFALPASAQFYLGGSLGRSHFVDVCSSGGFTTCKPRDTEWSAFAGWQLGRYLGVEGGYRAFGHASFNPGGNVKGNALELDGVGYLPLYGNFSLIGRIGVFAGKLKGESIEERTHNGTFGWGAQYDFSPQAGVRFEWQRYLKMGGGDFGARTKMDSLALGVVFRFE
jgi:OmpA-like transmembrane domain